MRLIGIVIVIVVACGGDPKTANQPPATEQPTSHGAQPAADAGPVVETPPADAAPPAPPPKILPVAIPSDHPMPEGELVTITQGAKAKFGGLVVKYVSHHHKHAEGGGSAGTWSLSFTRGSQTQTRELRSDGDLEAELTVHGALLVVTGTYDDVSVILAAKKAPKSLSEEDAWALAEKEATSHHLPGSIAGGSAENGILRLYAREGDDELWRAHVGLFTRRVWFSLPPGG